MTTWSTQQNLDGIHINKKLHLELKKEEAKTQRQIIYDSNRRPSPDVFTKVMFCRLAVMPVSSGERLKGRPSATPWRRMLSHTAIWAIIVNNFTFHYAFYVVMNWLPTYFDQVTSLHTQIPSSVTWKKLRAIWLMKLCFWHPMKIIGKLNAAMMA